jgi:beta-glucanase (GH16 family)
VEFRGQNLSEMRGSLHGPGYSANENLGRDFDTGVDLSEDFHTYGIVWSDLGVSFEFDGKPYFSALKKDLVGGRKWVFDHPFFIILNLAVGGTYLDDPDESTPFPIELVVDAVRVYRLSEP